MQLSWHTDAAPCLLCGVPVTPESWVGGIISDANGDWARLEQPWKFPPVYLDWRAELQTFDPGRQRPIMPPPGWAGKSAEELWEAVWGSQHVAYIGERDQATTVRMYPSWTPGGAQPEFVIPSTAIYVDALRTVQQNIANAPVLHEWWKEATCQS